MLVGYTYTNMYGNIDLRKSKLEYLITFVREAMSWQLKLQNYVDLSTAEAESITTTEVCKELLWIKNEVRKELLWIKKFFSELGFQYYNS